MMRLTVFTSLLLFFAHASLCKAQTKPLPPDQVGYLGAGAVSHSTGLKVTLVLPESPKKLV